jgi:UDP-N-acetylglucosamine 1-carboxyvinyltransferase
MDSLLIQGGFPLHGEIDISGAKNAALPILAATLLATEKVILSNVPILKDITTMIEVLRRLGVKVNINDDKSVTVIADNVTEFEAPYELVKTMRASILVLGPLLARFGYAKVSLPGGCAIGSRPVDLHLSALEKMGAKVNLQNGYIEAEVKGGLKGAEINFDQVTVGGTENIIMAATLAKGKTILHHAAQEPEIVDLVCFLRGLGAKISGEGTSTITIEGVKSLGGTTHAILPDRIETGTYLVAGAMTRGTIRLNKAKPQSISILLDSLREAGADIHQGEDYVELDMHGKRPGAISISTAPYPGFPTDMQAQVLALNCVADGQASVVENVFENRFMHVEELRRLGADLNLQGNTVISKGREELKQAPVMATDLRASASLILAALVAKGITEVQRIYHVDRGYERIEEKLGQMGARITRLSKPSDRAKKLKELNDKTIAE